MNGNDVICDVPAPGFNFANRNSNMLKIFSITALVLLLFTACGNNNDTQQTGDQQATASDSARSKSPATATKTIIFFGNSLTAGYGVEPSQAFPALIQDRIDSLQLPWKVINAGLSGETTAGGRSRIDWILRQPVDIFVLELGGNDGLRGIPVTETRANLQAIIDTVREKNPQVKIILAGMQVPPNMGQQYASQFRAVFQQLAEKNNTTLVPFLLEDVGGVPELNQPDGIHPNVEGHRIVAENVWEVLRGQLIEH
jgi:acyl-CoA thioesterase-1